MDNYEKIKARVVKKAVDIIMSTRCAECSWNDHWDDEGKCMAHVNPYTCDYEFVPLSLKDMAEDAVRLANEHHHRARRRS